MRYIAHASRTISHNCKRGQKRKNRKGLHQDPTLIGALLTLAGTYAVLGRKKEANHYIEDLLRLIPRYSLRALRKNPMFVHPELIEKLVESLRLAGLPE